MKTYLDFFKEISLIPRKSGNEEKIADYLVDFAESKGYTYYKDAINNVVIWKNASEGYEDKEILGLQSHVDMICEKEPGVVHNFSTDPLKIYTEGDFIKAKGTSLGADNGVGVAYMLSILDSNEIKTPKLECIFTVQEETTMNGARLIDEKYLLSNRMISFDNFSESDMWVSSANSKEWISKIDTEYEILTDDYKTYELTLSNFKGGHSGLDIGDEARINPIKLGINLIRGMNVYINKIEGGSMVNIIPRELKIIFSTRERIENLLMSITRLNKKSNRETVELKEIKPEKRCFSKVFSENIIGFIDDFRNGVIYRDNLSKDIILSANMGALEEKANEIIIKYSLRANEKELGEKLKLEIEKNMTRYKVKVKDFDEMLGYFSKSENVLADKCAEIYREIFNREIRKVNVQACLECGFFAEKIKDFKYISIAPNIYNAHSPEEKFSISSANRMWRYIVNILKEI